MDENPIWRLCAWFMHVLISMAIKISVIIFPLGYMDKKACLFIELLACFYCILLLLLLFQKYVFPYRLGYKIRNKYFHTFYIPQVRNLIKLHVAKKVQKLTYKIIYMPTLPTYTLWTIFRLTKIIIQPILFYLKRENLKQQSFNFYSVSYVVKLLKNCLDHTHCLAYSYTCTFSWHSMASEVRKETNEKKLHTCASIAFNSETANNFAKSTGLYIFHHEAVGLLTANSKITTKFF